MITFFFYYWFSNTSNWKCNGLYLRFTGSAWVTLSYGSPGSWSIGTVVYLAKRNDTRQPNSSPLTTGKPVYRWDVDIIYFLLKLPILSTYLPVSFSKWKSKLNTVANAISVCLFCYAPKITECEAYYFCPVCHSLWN